MNTELDDLLERFRRGPELLAVILTGVYGEEVDYTPAPDRWNIRQIMAHLADAELVGACRLRWVIAEDNPPLAGYDQNAWKDRLPTVERKHTASLESFRRIRLENHEMLKALPESTFERTGNHSELGPLTLRNLLEIYTEHAEGHARQIQELRRLYAAAKGKK